MAKFVADKFTDFGIPSVTHYDLDVLLNYPLAPPSVKLLGDAPYTATMAEDLLDFDTTSDTLWRNHTFHGYAPSGTATAPMVYAVRCSERLSERHSERHSERTNFPSLTNSFTSPFCRSHPPHPPTHPPSELRPPRRLRRPRRSQRHRRQQDRPRALRRVLPWPQGDERAGARGRGRDHLQRPRRRRLRPGGSLSGRTVAARIGGAAGICAVQ